MNILVLGHSGFVGSNVIDHFEGSDVNIKGVSLSSGIDLRDKAQLIDVLRAHSPDYIINCAAHVGSLNYVTENAGTVIVDNCKLITSLYESVLAQCENSVVINPIANCGYPGSLLLYREDEWLNGPVHDSVLSYGSTRRLLVDVARCFSMQYGIRSVNLMVPNMYGEHDSPDPNKAHALNALVAKFVRADYLGDRAVEIWGTGSVIREWLYAKDFSRIIEKVVYGQVVAGHRPVNIAQNDGLTIKDLALLINSKFGDKFEIEFDVSRPDGAPKKVMDNARFVEVFGDYEFESFSSGIEKTIAYYRSIYPY